MIFRTILIGVVVASAMIAACGRTPKVSAARDTNRSKDANPIAAWDRLTQGRTVEHAESRFMLIENDTCPGTRTVTSRFAKTNDALLQLTEDNSQVECSEGTRARPTVLVWRGGRYTAPPDTIHATEPWLGITDGALLVGTDDGGMLPSEHYYYSIDNGRRLFSSQFPAVSFGANGTRRYLGVTGGWGDTASTVYYSTATAVIQTLHILRDSTMRTDDYIVVDTMALDGPGRQCCNNILIASGAKDTLPVKGITLTFRLVNLGMDGLSGDIRRSYVARIVDDRLAIEAAK